LKKLYMRESYMKVRSWAIALICLLALSAPAIAESGITNVSAAVPGCGIALNDNGTVWLWGSISDNDPTGLQPIIMPGIDHVVGISGYMRPAVLKDDGTVWILRNYPYFENATMMETWPDKEPVQAIGLSDITAISGSNSGAYGDNLLALKDDGTVWVVGSNLYGQQGTDAGYGNQNFLSLDAVRVSGLSDVKAISMGIGHALALKEDGTVWAWGYNDMGQLGDGTINYNKYPAGKTTPVMVKELTNVTAISAGNEFSMALKNDGTVWTWGRNTFGMLGDGIPGNVEEYSTTPVQVVGLTNVTAISAGNWFALALKDDGTVWAWGDNRNYGMLGDYTTETRNVPGQVDGLSGIVSISAGIDFCFALDKNGAVWAWGEDSAGQLGDGQQGMINFRATPCKVSLDNAISGSAVVPISSVSPGPTVQANVPVADNGSIEYMSADDGVIYAFSANGLVALDSNGDRKWNITINGTWTYGESYDLITRWNETGTGTQFVNNTLVSSEVYSMSGTDVKMVPVFASDGGYVYLYAFANALDSMYDPLDRCYLNKPAKNVEKELIAVTPDGKIEWTRSFVDDIAVQDLSHVETHNGRIYLYHGYNETVIDASGRSLFTLYNIAEPVSVDEDGNIYSIRAVGRTLPAMGSAIDGGYFDFRIPSNVVEKYRPDGVAVWRTELEKNASLPYFMPAVWNDEIGMPLYRNGMLYVPVDHGIIALYKNGTIRWTKEFSDDYRIFNLMPTDSNGNLYLDYRYLDNDTIMALKFDGTETGQVTVNQNIRCAYDGILYVDGNFPEEFLEEYFGNDNISSDNLEKATIRAYDINRGVYAWNFTTPIGQTNTVTINKSNVLALIPDYSKYGYPANSIIFAQSLAEIVPTGNFTYIYFRTADWDKPVVYDRSAYTYYSAIYALDMNGKLVWQKPLDSFVTAAAANNTTIYYGTDNGKISVSVVEAAAGLVLIGSALLLMFGYVSRARSKIDKNENRNGIFRFIVERPGSTLYEITRGTGMNMGTIRYHMMILGINHRIVSFNDEGKFVRYFANSNSYSREDQQVISIMRRESIGRILKYIVEKPEATNADLCSELGLPESTVSKYLGELSRKGILVRSSEQNIRASYSIKKEYEASILKAMKLMDSSTITLIGNDEENQADACA
jgi:alpha-tubulin suppressor-like RCC1 family protein/predicted transcriptional regulator